MKKLLMMGALALTGISGISGNLVKAKHEIYPETFIVSKVDEVNDIVVFSDWKGDIWEIEGVEDWFEGDIVSALMYNNGTPDTHDDIIVKTRFSGFYVEDGEFHTVPFDKE